MSKKDGFSEDFFLQKGFTRNASGGFDPPKFVHKIDLLTSNKNHSAYDTTKCAQLIQKEKIVETNDFNHAPVTEWFISNYNVPSKKNSRQNFVSKTTHKMISLPSKKHAEYVKMTAMQYKVFGDEFKKTVERLGLKYPLRIQFTFIRSTKHSFDYCNLAQSCEDIMKGHWFPDDSADYLIPVFAPYEYDKEMPGVKIKLLY